MVVKGEKTALSSFVPMAYNSYKVCGNFLLVNIFSPTDKNYLSYDYVEMQAYFNIPEDENIP